MHAVYTKHCVCEVMIVQVERVMGFFDQSIIKLQNDHIKGVPSLDIIDIAPQLPVVDFAALQQLQQEEKLAVHDVVSAKQQADLAFMDELDAVSHLFDTQTSSDELLERAEQVAAAKIECAQEKLHDAEAARAAWRSAAERTARVTNSDSGAVKRRVGWSAVKQEALRQKSQEFEATKMLDPFTRKRKTNKSQEKTLLQQAKRNNS